MNRFARGLAAIVFFLPIAVIACGDDDSPNGTGPTADAGTADAAAKGDATTAGDGGGTPGDSGPAACSAVKLTDSSTELLGGGDEQIPSGGIVRDGTYELIGAARYGAELAEPLGETYRATLVVKGKHYELVTSGNIPADEHTLLTNESGTVEDNTDGSLILTQSCPGTTRYEFAISEYNDGVSLYTGGKTASERVEYFFRSVDALACPGTLSATMPSITVEAGGSTRVTVHLDRSAEAVGRTVEILPGNGLSTSLNQFGELLFAGENDLTIDVYAEASNIPGTHNLELLADISSSGCVAKASLPVNVVASTVLDSTFGAGGVVSIPLKTAGQREDFVDLAALPSGGVAAITSPHSETTYRLHRVTAAGALDPSFGSGGTLILPDSLYLARGLAAQPDGKLLVVGSNQGSDGIVLRYATDGTLDPSWGTAGVVTVSLQTSFHDVELYQAAVAPDGSVYVAGYGDNGIVAKLTPGGALDTTFASTGYIHDDAMYVERIAVRSDNGVVVLGHDAFATTATARDAKGALITSFATNGVATFGLPDDFDPPSLLPTADGKFLVFVPTKNAADTFVEITRLTSTGGADVSYGASGKTTLAQYPSGTSFNLGVAVDASGRALVPVSTDLEAVTVARVTVAGAADTTYGPDGVRSIRVGTENVYTRNVVTLANGSAHAVAAETDTKLFVLKLAP